MGALQYDTDFMFIAELDRSVYVPSIVDEAIKRIDTSDSGMVEFEAQDLIVELHYTEDEGELTVNEVYICTDKLDVQPDLEDYVKEELNRYFEPNSDRKHLAAQSKQIKKEQIFAL